MEERSNLWIGLADVVPKPECQILQNSKGAFANVMAWAKSAQEFRQKVENSLRDLDLELVDLEDAQTFSERGKGDVVFDDQIHEIKERVEHGGEDVAFGTFYKWKHDNLSQ
jgi:hypothetical protein